MRYIARFLLIGMVVGAFVVLLAYSYLPIGEPLRYLGARIG